MMVKMKKFYAGFICALTFSGFVTADISATVQVGTSDYKLSYEDYKLSYENDDNQVNFIDRSFVSSDLLLTYSGDSGVKFGVKIGGLGQETYYEDDISKKSVSRDDNSIFAQYKILSIPVTVGYYSSELYENDIDMETGYDYFNNESYEQPTGYQYIGNLKNSGYFAIGSYIFPISNSLGFIGKFGYQISSVKESYQYRLSLYDEYISESRKTDGTASIYGGSIYYLLNSSTTIVGSYDVKNFSYDNFDDGSSLEEEMSNLSMSLTYNF
jgi:hypothetical protein